MSTALRGELVGVREEDDDRWLITFMDIDLGHIVGNAVQPLPPAEIDLGIRRSPKPNPPIPAFLPSCLS